MHSKKHSLKTKTTARRSTLKTPESLPLPLLFTDSPKMLHVPRAVQPGLNTWSTPDHSSGLFNFPSVDNFEQYFWKHKSDLMATWPPSCCLPGWKALHVFLLQELLKAGDIRLKKKKKKSEKNIPHVPANVQFYSATILWNIFGFQLVFTGWHVKAHVFSIFSEKIIMNEFTAVSFRKASINQFSMAGISNSPCF